MLTLQATLFIDLPLKLTLASDSVSLVVDSMPTSLIASVTFLAISQAQLWTAHHSPSSSSASLPYLRPLSPVLVILDQAPSTSHLTTLFEFGLAVNDFAKFQSCNARLLTGMGR